MGIKDAYFRVCLFVRIGSVTDNSSVLSDENLNGDYVATHPSRFNSVVVQCSLYLIPT